MPTKDLYDHLATWYDTRHAAHAAAEAGPTDVAYFRARDAHSAAAVALDAFLAERPRLRKLVPAEVAGEVESLITAARDMGIPMSDVTLLRDPDAEPPAMLTIRRVVESLAALSLDDAGDREILIERLSRALGIA